VAPAEVPALAQAVAALPRVRLRGLMAIPEPAADTAAQRAPHRALRELLSALQAQGLALDTLSMGMSADLEAAVAEGATLVRVGTAIFGGRG
jgi:PLP dependent protein